MIGPKVSIIHSIQTLLLNKAGGEAQATQALAWALFCKSI